MALITTCVRIARPYMQTDAQLLPLSPSITPNFLHPTFVTTTVYKETESTRREGLWKPRVETVLELLRKYGILENCY